MQLDLNTCTGLKQWAGDNHDGQKRKGALLPAVHNIGDPVQRAAVELLELQPPHSKAQYIANALVYYNTHFSDDPQPLKVPAIDRAAIEAIVREIMRQDEQASDKAVSTGESSPPKKNKIALPPQEQTTEPSEGASEVDDMTRNLIASTMAAFRRNG